jgi:hypothetical protein
MQAREHRSCYCNAEADGAGHVGVIHLLADRQVQVKDRKIFKRK